VYFFQNNNHQVYCSSADWMERNLSNRIEVCFPILKKKLAARILADLELYVADDIQTWEMQPDGEYTELVPKDKERLGVQSLLLRQLA
jgi:polyphosphate kinase